MRKMSGGLVRGEGGLEAPWGYKIVCSIYDAFGILIKFFAHGLMRYSGSHLFCVPSHIIHSSFTAGPYKLRYLLHN